MDITIMQMILLIAVGLFAGALSGVVGIGGGIIIVPAMIYLLHMSQLQAQGISLSVLVLPVGILGVMNYYKAGHVNFNYAFLIAAGFFVGSYFGSKYALKLPINVVKFIFGLFLMVIAGALLWKSGGKIFTQP